MKKQKIIKAWAVLRYEDDGIGMIQFDYQSGLQYEIFPTRQYAIKWLGKSAGKVVPVEIKLK